MPVHAPSATSAPLLDAFLHTPKTLSSGLPRVITINSGSTHDFFILFFALLSHGFPTAKIPGIKG